MKNGFFRGHGLGNDYVVMDPKELSFTLTPAGIEAHLQSQLGAGQRRHSWPLVPSRKADFGLRIFNPDGSEAEKSGNGLRIFARYLHATGKTRKKHFTVETKGGLVTIDLHLDRHGDASAVTVEMGRATFAPSALPCTLPVEELIEQPIEAAGRSFTFTGVSVGNPHCVLFKADRSVLVTGRSAGAWAGARASRDLSQADQCATGGADRRQRIYDPDLGARRRRDAGLRIVVLRCRQRGCPSRVW